MANAPDGHAEGRGYGPSRRDVLLGTIAGSVAAVQAATTAKGVQPATGSPPLSNPGQSGTGAKPGAGRNTPSLVRAEIDPRTGYIKTPKARATQRPRIIAWYPIGNSSPDEGERHIGWNIKKDGWSGFVQTWALPAAAAGFDVIQIHNPGGTLAKEDMAPDQFITAKEAGLNWVLNGFVEAWKPVTKRLPVIAYLGALPRNKRLQGLIDRQDRFGFLVNLAACYRLPLEAGMDVAFDAMHNVREGSWELAVYRMLTALGVRTYVEPAPNASDFPIFHANFQIVNTTLERTLKNAEPWMAPLEQLSGERIILLNNLPEGKKWADEPQWVPQWMAHWIHQGWSVAVSPAWMLKAKVRPWDAVRPLLDRLRDE